jgi:hypothetical protein
VNPSLDITIVVEQALRKGKERLPEHLKEYLELSDNPIECLGGWGNFESILNILSKDFPLHSDSIEVQVELCRWLLNNFRNWEKIANGGELEVSLLFAVSAYLNWDGKFWRAIPQDFKLNREFLINIAAKIKKFDCTFEVYQAHKSSTWEEELCNSFLSHDLRLDWSKLFDIWPRLEPRIFSNHFLSEAISCLCKFDFSLLIEATNSINNTPIAMLALKELQVSERLKIARLTTNERVAIASIYITVGAMPQQQLNSTELNDLTTVLKAASKLPEKWNRWMTLFNAYPARYVELQRPLGRALADGNAGAIESYVQSIDFNQGTTLNVRECIASCLGEFKTLAPQDHREKLWQKAFEKWSEWNFKNLHLDSFLFQVAQSPVDFAVVCYWLECQDSTERQKEKEAIMEQLRTADDQWHESYSHFISHWHRLISRLQPLWHIEKIENHTQSQYLWSCKYDLLFENEKRYMDILLHSQVD